MWQNELVDRFDRAAETSEAGAVAVRVGHRPHLNTVAIVVWDTRYRNNSENFHAVEVETMEEAAETASQILTDAGFGTEFPNCRLDFKHAETGKNLPSWSGTSEVDAAQEPGAPVEQILAEALRQNNVEMRRMFGMVTECLQNREERIDQDRDDIMELSRQEVLSRAESEMTQILAEEAAMVDVESDPLKEHAGEILGAIAQKFLGASATPRDTVLQILRHDPALTAALAQDEEVVGLFNEAILEEAAGMARAAEEERTAAQPEDPPDPPNPMAPEEVDDGIPF